MRTMGRDKRIGYEEVKDFPGGKHSVLVRVFVIGTLLLPVFALAQQRDYSGSQSFPQGAPTEITVSVAVNGKDGNLVSGLPRDVFTVLDGKVKYEIASFVDQEAPTTIAIVFDLSGSIGGLKGAKPKAKLLSAVEGIAGLIESDKKSNEYFIIGFHNDHQLLSHGNAEEAISGLNKLRSLPLSGQSEFFDACHFAMDKVTLGKYPKKAIILISDGEDTYSRLTLDDIRQLLKERGVVIYAIDIGDGANSAYPSTSVGPKVLDKLAEASGGLALHPRKADDVGADVQRVEADIRARYMIGFKPPVTSDKTKCYSFKVRLVTSTDALSNAKSFATRSRQSHCPATIPAR